MVGSAILRRLAHCDDLEFILKSRSELDLLDQSAVTSFIKERPDYIFWLLRRLEGLLQTICCEVIS